MAYTAFTLLVPIDRERKRETEKQGLGLVIRET